MNIRVLYNQHTQKYRIAYQVGKFVRRWKFAQRVLVSSQVSQIGMAKYVESSIEIAEFDSIGEAEAFIAKHVAPQSEWYDPRDDAWEVEAEVDIPGKKGYHVPTINTDEESD